MFRFRNRRLPYSVPFTAQQAMDVMCIHGFHTMASTLLNELGYNRDWIERQLAHQKRDGVRDAYNCAQYLPQRRKMMQEYADYPGTVREKARQAAYKARHAPGPVPEIPARAGPLFYLR